MKYAKASLRPYIAQIRTSGGSLSAADIYTYLYFEEMNVDPKDPNKADRDRFVLSKGHTLQVTILYWHREDIFR